jgi:hypothetical protein
MLVLWFGVLATLFGIFGHVIDSQDPIELIGGQEHVEHAREQQAENVWTVDGE